MQVYTKTCPSCGRVGRFNTYCSGACKQKAYRARKKNKSMNYAREVSQALMEDLGEHEACEVFDLLNTVTSSKQAVNVDNALRLIINSYRHLIRVANQGKRK